jgi:tripartite-type tricarboxylate transporter receptor subunit TctC
MPHSISRRDALAALSSTVVGAALVAPRSAMAAEEAWPSKPIRWIIPYAAGATSDILTRAVAEKIGQRIGQRLGQPIVVENKTGAGGNAGTDFVAKSAPDGYTWVLGNIGPMAVNATLYKNLPFDPEKDFVPISLLLAYPNLIVVNPAFGPRSMKELLQYGKTHSIPYAGNGVGTSLHLTGELLARTAGIKLQHIPYRGEAPGLTDTMAGVVPMAITPISAGLPLVKSGKLRALAVTSSKRSSALPDVPTVSESGLPGFEVIGWIGILTPRGTPEPVVQRLADEFTTVMESPEIQRVVEEMASYVPPLGPDYFARFIQSETTKWHDVVVAADLHAE